MVHTIAHAFVTNWAMDCRSPSYILSENGKIASEFFLDVSRISRTRNFFK